MTVRGAVLATMIGQIWLMKAIYLYIFNFAICTVG